MASIDSIDLNSLELPFQPQVLTAVIRLKEDSNMNFKELDRLIRSDQNLAALLLKIANSSFYSRGIEIKTLQQAIARIGFQTVLSFTMAASARNAFKANYARFKKQVWEHSMITAICSMELAVACKQAQIKEEAFIGGLLHDIGKVALNTIDREAFIRVLDMTKEAQKSFVEAENEVFGFNHAEIGVRILEHWNLPALYCNVIKYHSSGPTGELDQESRNVISLCAYSNFLAKKYAGETMNEEELQHGQVLRGFIDAEEEELAAFEENLADHLEKSPFYQYFMNTV